MKISNALYALVARKRKDFNKRLNCSIVNVLFFKRSGKEFHAAGPEHEKARLAYVDSRHLGTSRSVRVAERSCTNYRSTYFFFVII